MRSFLLVLFVVLCSSNSFGQSRHRKKPMKHFAAGDTVKAMTILNQKIDKHSDIADLYLYRGKIKLERNDLNAAMADFNTFCSLNSTCGEAGYLKSWILYKQGNYRAAVEQLSEQTRTRPTAEAFLYLGLSHIQLKNYGPALGAFEKSLELDPTNYLATYNTGLAAYRESQFSLAQHYFEQATNILPSDYDAWYGLGLTQNAGGYLEESNKSYRQALAITPEDGGSLFNIGVNYFGLGDLEQACSYWGKAEAAGNLAATPSLERHCQEKEATTH